MRKNPKSQFSLQEYSRESRPYVTSVELAEAFTLPSTSPSESGRTPSFVSQQEEDIFLQLSSPSTASQQQSLSPMPFPSQNDPLPQVTHFYNPGIPDDKIKTVEVVQPAGSKKGLIIGIVLLVVVGVAVALGVVFGINPGDDGKEDTPTGAPTLQPLPALLRAGDDYIGVVLLDETVDERIKDAFEGAAHKWSQKITREFSGVRIGAQFDQLSNTGCSFVESDFPLRDFVTRTYEAGLLPHFLLAADFVRKGAREGVLVSSPCLAVVEDNLQKPILGVVQIDLDFFEAVLADGEEFAVILHEIAHALGLGVLWRREGLAVDQVYDVTRVANLTAEPRYIGRFAREQHPNIRAGVTADDFIEVEDGKLRFSDAEIIAGFGLGVADTHISEEIFGTEVMTFDFEPRQNDAPISLLTLGMLQDLGIEVDLNEADDFQVEVAEDNESDGEVDDGEAGETKKALRGERSWLEILRKKGDVPKNYKELFSEKNNDRFIVKDL